jgi:hypothetical protein
LLRREQDDRGRDLHIELACPVSGTDCYAGRADQRLLGSNMELDGVELLEQRGGVGVVEGAGKGAQDDCGESGNKNQDWRPPAGRPLEPCGPGGPAAGACRPIRGGCVRACRVDGSSPAWPTGSLSAVSPSLRARLPADSPGEIALDVDVLLSYSAVWTRFQETIA